MFRNFKNNQSTGGYYYITFAAFLLPLYHINIMTTSAKSISLSGLSADCGVKLCRYDASFTSAANLTGSNILISVDSYSDIKSEFRNFTITSAGYAFIVVHNNSNIESTYTLTVDAGSFSDWYMDLTAGTASPEIFLHSEQRHDFRIYLSAGSHTFALANFQANVRVLLLDYTSGYGTPDSFTAYSHTAAGTTSGTLNAPTTGWYSVIVYDSISTAGSFSLQID